MRRRAATSVSSCRCASSSSLVGRAAGAGAARIVIGRSCRSVLLLLAATACGEPAILEVGRIGYTAEELVGRDARQKRDLSVLTAFGLATSDGRLEEVADPFVRRELRSLLLQRSALEIGASAAGMDEEALQAVYYADPEYELTVRHLVILAERWRTPEAREHARRRAEEALERARSGEPFPALAAEYSDEAGAAERGGLLRPGRSGSWAPEFWEAARSLEEGEVSEVVETEFGFHVLRLEARDPVPFPEARDRVLHDLVALSDALTHSARWIEERTQGARVDTAAIARWQQGLDPGRPLVHWPGRELPSYEARHLDDYTLTLGPEDLATLRHGSVEAVARTVEAVARNDVLLDYAGELGIELSAAQRATIQRRWQERMGSWARELGFAPGRSDPAIKAAALEALHPHGQLALIARGEVLRTAVVLLRLYPVADHTEG
jgi:hypothetical protein